MSEIDFDVVVVGGGPAGCTVASYLARDGYKVALLERDRHPRHRIGESLLPSMMPILVDFGLLEECERRGFQRKPGATFTWGKSDQPWHLKWKENPFLPHLYAYHVERSSFDEMLWLYARSVGVDAREETRVVQALYADENKARVTGVKWEGKDGQSGELRARFVVDASGMGSTLGKTLSTRRYDDKMRQVAFYTYFNNVVGPTGEGAEEIRDHIIITTCPKGWFWWIPINSKSVGQVSCGLVTGQEFKAEFRDQGPEAFYFAALEECPAVKAMLGPAAERSQPMRSVMDWSYVCDVTAGPGFFLCGDAAAFLDPLISTGVSLAMLSAYSASICLNTILKEPEKEQDVTGFYQKNYRQMYEVTRDFLHYFYAGATSAYADELFWKGRRNLRMGENVGAKQAFTYFTAIIPGNPHPAVSKQISLFKNMLTHVDYPEEKLKQEFSDQAKYRQLAEVNASELTSATRLVVNGTCEKSFVIHEKTRQLVETWGVAYDIERPVLSNTASWLMGRNFFPVSAEQAALLQRLDSFRTLGELREELTASGVVTDWAALMKTLCADRLVLQCRA